MTVAELERWSLERNWGPDRRQRLDTYLGRFTIQPSNRALCQLWARVIVQARRQGRPIQPADAWIAATALLHDIPLVSHNRQDYAGVGNLIVISEDGAR